MRILSEKEEFLKNFAWFWLAESVYYAYSAKKMKEWQEEMKAGLFKGYDAQGAKKMGGVDEFIKHVGKRDNEFVCIPVDFEKIDENKFIYRMYACPFLEAREKLKSIGVGDCKEISANGYLKAKMEYFLGDDWKLQTTRCIWESDKHCEHVFVK
jgi:hypothetical protein